MTKLTIATRVWRTLCAAIIVITTVTASGDTVRASDDRKHADLILAGGTVYTLVPERPRVEAVAVSGQYIVFAGPREEAEAFRGPDTRMLDVTGKTVLPGLVDAHAHLGSLGKMLRQVKLFGTESPSEIRELVLEALSAVPPGTWIEGRGWDQNDWDIKEFPTWKDLEGTGTHPVCLRRVDGHAAWVNKRTLELCGITRGTPDPEGGRIIRDADGEPTGVLIDDAEKLVTDVKPEPSFEELLERHRVAIKECWKYGLTGVHDAGVEEEDLAVYRYLLEHGELVFRVYGMLEGDEPEFAEAQIKKGPVIDEGHYFTIRALKLYADGALGSRGAALLEPYTDEPGSSGLFMHTRDELLKWTVLALDHGFQVCTHAIGDAGNRLMLDVYEEALTRSDVRDPRLRIEHAQVLAPEDIPRFKELGVIPSMQPTHATSDMYWAEERLGPERVKGAYVWRRLLDAGCVIPCGSDFPVEGVDPLLGIYAAVTREDQKGWPEGGWHPEERMTIDEAVAGFSTSAAFASFEEDIKGTIELGNLADFTVLDVDIMNAAAGDIPTARVAYTIVGGAVVYASPPD